jgi:hypothetical protein
MFAISLGAANTFDFSYFLSIPSKILNQYSMCGIYILLIFTILILDLIPFFNPEGIFHNKLFSKNYTIIIVYGISKFNLTIKNIYLRHFLPPAEGKFLISIFSMSVVCVKERISCVHGLAPACLI